MTRKIKGTAHLTEKLIMLDISAPVTESKFAKGISIISDIGIDTPKNRYHLFVHLFLRILDI
jgi:hypothetical protein